MKHITFMVVRIEATEKGEYMTVIGDNDTKLSLPAIHMDSIDIGRHIEVGLHEPSNRVQMVKVGEKTLWNYTDEEMKTQIEKEKTEKFAKMKEAYEGRKPPIRRSMTSFRTSTRSASTSGARTAAKTSRFCTRPTSSMFARWR